jgi:ABC-type sugar transport system permease subunit
LRGRDALRASSNVVKHHWWRAFVTNGVLTVLSAAVGPVVGLGLLIGLNVAQEITSGVSATLYAIVYPVATIGVTLLYLRLKAAPAVPTPVAAPPATAPGGIAPEPA